MMIFPVPLTAKEPALDSEFVVLLMPCDAVTDDWLSSDRLGAYRSTTPFMVWVAPAKESDELPLPELKTTLGDMLAAATSNKTVGAVIVPPDPATLMLPEFWNVTELVAWIVPEFDKLGVLIDSVPSLVKEPLTVSAGAVVDEDQASEAAEPEDPPFIVVNWRVPAIDPCAPTLTVTF